MRGFAFITFSAAEGAVKAVEWDGSEYMGRTLRIQESTDSSNERKEKAKFTAGAKVAGCVEVFVGNMPWDVDEDMLRKAFEPAGKVLGVRLARHKDSGELRGFGHVQLDSDAACERAVNTLNGNDLNGRPMRIDYSGNKTVIYGEARRKQPPKW